MIGRSLLFELRGQGLRQCRQLLRLRLPQKGPKYLKSRT